MFLFIFFCIPKFNKIILAALSNFIIIQSIYAVNAVYITQSWAQRILIEGEIIGEPNGIEKDTNNGPMVNSMQVFIQHADKGWLCEAGERFQELQEHGIVSLGLDE